MCKDKRMISLSDLHYHIKKNVFFSDVIETPAYNIYYSDNLLCPYWNHAEISDISALNDILGKIMDEFKQLNRSPCIHISANQTGDLVQLQTHKFKVTITEKWFRFENDFKPLTCFAKEVETEKERKDFLKFFTEDYNKNYKYGKELTSACISAIDSLFDDKKYRHFISYEGDEVAAIGSIGEYEGYYVIFNISVNNKYFDKEDKDAVLNSCIRHFSGRHGLGLNIKLNNSNDNSIEKWYQDKSFKKMTGGYYLTL